MANEIATVRGFLLRVEVGRQGLVVARLLQDDSTTVDYQIQDLDADPERFNERLSKLGILRDAMDRAEPVEIEYSGGEGGVRNIDRVARITRDSLGWPAQVATVDGLVADVQLFTDNRTGAVQEKADQAKVAVLKADLSTVNLLLDLQVPERHVADQQLQWILSALRGGDTLRFFYDGKTSVIAGIGSGSSTGALGDSSAQTFDGFVESLSPSAPAGQSGQLALFRFTTAPAFAGSGNYVPLQDFAPDTLSLLVLKSSPAYELVEAGLRDNLRMQVRAYRLDAGAGSSQATGTVVYVQGQGNANEVRMQKDTANPLGDGKGVAATETAPAYYLASGVTLLAPLASASRPVWIKISRELLDEGPEKRPCSEGLPSNDLAPRTLRDLQIPYPAAWIGCGCFNHGVYRFQFKLAVKFEVLVDGKCLCVHTGKDTATQFAHACLGGEHCVEVRLDDWTCAREFVMDVYRIR